MKGTCLLSTLLLAVTVSAQNRIVLVEEFTNTGCGPCASWSPELGEALAFRTSSCLDKTITRQMAQPERFSLTLSKGIEDHRMSVNTQILIHYVIH